MKKELHFLGEISEDGSVTPTHFKVTKEIAKDENNSVLDLLEGTFVYYGNSPADCPPDTADGYYVKSGGNCVYVPYG